MIEVFFQVDNTTTIERPSIGQSLLLLGVVPTITADLVPYLFRTPRQVFQYYGNCALSKAYYEAYLQGAPFIATVSIQSENSFTSALEILADFDTDIFCLTDTHYSEVIASGLGDYSRARLNSCHPTITVVSVSGGADDLVDLAPMSIQSGSDSINADSTPYLVLTAGDLRFRTNTVRQYTSSTAATVAGVIASTPSEVSVIRKKAQGCTIPTRWSKQNISSLYGAGYNFFENTPDRDVVLLGGRTLNGGDFEDLSNTRAAQFVLVAIRNSTEQFIGEGASIYRVRSVIEDTLEGLVAVGKIKGYSYDLDYYDRSGVVDLSLEIVPVFSIRSVTVTARLHLERTY